MAVSAARPADLRVLLMLDSLQVGGPARVIMTLVLALRRRGVDARLVHLGMGNWEQMDAEARSLSIPVHNLKLGSLLDPRPRLWLANYIRRERFDLLHTHGRYADLVGRPAALLAGRSPISTIHYIVETESGWRAAVRRQLDFLTARMLCARVITVSNAQREVYRRASRVPARRIETVMNGVDTELFRPDPLARTRVRAELSIPAAAQVCSTIAMLRPGKAVEHLLEAAAATLARSPNLRFLVIGDGPERPALESRAAALGVHDRVLFLGLRSDVAPLLAASDIYVHPSLFESLPTSVIEAMAVGLPVVATRVGGVPEVVADGHTGHLVSPGRPDELSAAIVRLLQPAAREAMGAAGRAWVETHASTHVWIDQLLELYARVAYPRVLGRQT